MAWAPSGAVLRNSAGRSGILGGATLWVHGRGRELPRRVGPAALDPSGWKNRGVFVMTWEAIQSLDPAQHGEAGKTSIKSSGTAGSGPIQVEIDVVGANEKSVEPGGEMPEAEAGAKEE